MLKRSIQAWFSTNCMAALVVSKPEISGSVTRKDSTAATSAIQRTAPALLSRPSASSRPPQTMGSQMDRLSNILILRPRQRPNRALNWGPM